MNCRSDQDPTEPIRDHLRKLERMVVAKLPTDTRDRKIAAQRIRSWIGDQLAELTWWRPGDEE